MTEDLLRTEIPEEQEQEDDAELFTVVTTGQQGGIQTTGNDPNDENFHHIEFVHDVPLRLSVEIGQATLSVREILALNVGKLVEFTKVVGEPMDITVSGRLMARGEIVVVNERYGVRISEVTRPDETGNYSSGDN